MACSGPIRSRMGSAYTSFRTLTLLAYGAQYVAICLLIICR